MLRGKRGDCASYLPSPYLSLDLLCPVLCPGSRLVIQSPALWLPTGSSNGKPQHKIRGQEERLPILLSFFQLCWDLDSGCIHIQLQFLLVDSFMVSGIPGLQEHHSFPCPYKLRVVTASCSCKPLCASISFAGSQISANNLFIKVSSCHLSCFFHTVIYSVSEKLRQHLMRPEYSAGHKVTCSWSILFTTKISRKKIHR